MDGYRLAILIPAYREGATIGPVVAAATAYGTVFVGDDNSPDDTADVARANGATVLHNPVNLGYDGNINRLFQEAADQGFDGAVTMDADGEHDPGLLETFRSLLAQQDVDLVLGARPRKQRFAEMAMGLYIRQRYGVRDILCGMKGYDMALFHQNGGFDHSDSIGTELAINAIRRGASFRQVDVTGTPRQDAPRFDRRFRANMRIFSALWRVLRRDVHEMSGGLE